MPNGRLAISRPGRVSGQIAVPGDKSITHRAVLLNALCAGQAHISGAGLGADCRSTIDCIRSLGAEVVIDGSSVTVSSPGFAGLSEPRRPLDCGNSGTTIRLLLGLLAGSGFFSVLVGDSSLSERPMGRVAAPLRALGALIYGRGGGERAPLVVDVATLTGDEIAVPVASAQVKSALLIAGLFARGQTRIRQPAQSRDHTELMLAQMGVQLEIDGPVVAISGGQPLHSVNVSVPADFSSAAYWLVLGATHQQAEIELLNIGLNPTRAGALAVLERMGGQITRHLRPGTGEIAGDLHVCSSRLTATAIGGAEIPIIIDEIPILAVAATQASGTTVISDAAELRVKESDRIAATVANLRALGATIEETPDGMIIEGPTRLSGAQLDSYGDHRVAMAMAVAASIADGESQLSGAGAVGVSYPDFFPTLGKVALDC